MPTPGTSWSRPALVLAIYLALAAIGIVWSSFRGHPNVWRLEAREDPEVLLGAITGLLMGLGLVFLSRLAVHRYEWARALHRDFRGRIGPLSGTEILVLAGASSVGEEIFFRGALLPAVGLLPSSVFFALLHVGPRGRHLPWTLASFGVGLLFGQLYLWSGDLTGPVAAHFVVNALNMRHLDAHEMR